jgi:hypothetical protein
VKSLSYSFESQGLGNVCHYGDEYSNCENVCSQIMIPSLLQNYLKFSEIFANKFSIMDFMICQTFLRKHLVFNVNIIIHFNEETIWELAWFYASDNLPPGLIGILLIKNILKNLDQRIQNYPHGRLFFATA